MQAYMERQGYKWMFEVPSTDDDDEEQKPLLEEVEQCPAHNHHGAHGTGRT